MTTLAAAKPNRRRLVLGIILVGVMMLIAVMAIVPVRSSSGMQWNWGFVPLRHWQIKSVPMILSERDGSTLATGRVYQFGPLVLRGLSTMTHGANALQSLESSTGNVVKEEPGGDPEGTSGSRGVDGETSAATGASEASSLEMK